MKSRAVVAFAAVLGFLVPGVVLAQEQFFTAPLRPGILETALVDGDHAFVLADDGMRRRGNEPAGSAERHFVTTARSDYMSTDWTYEITFRTSADAPDDVLFIGLGEGVGDTSFFNEPRNSLNFRIHQGTTAFGTEWRVDVAAHDVGFLSFPYLASVGNLPGPAGGTHIARIRKIGGEVTFEILGTGIGLRIPDIAAAAPFLAGSPSRIFFGNASSAYSYRDARVLPEALGG